MRDISLGIRKVQSALDAFKDTAITAKVTRTIKERLESEPRPFDFAVYFADSDRLLYQLEAWIKPFEQLSEAGMSTAFILKSPTVARAIAVKTSLPILLTRSMSTIEAFVAEHRVAGVFYVNNSQANFTALRMTEPAHIHLNHGESEKSSMVSNQLKAYDYAFIAGDAAEERILARVKGIHRSKLVKIGRPQLDVRVFAAAVPTAGARRTILYAPTWEGDSKEMAYSSIAAVGVRFVQEILADERYTLVFRAHPKTGTWSREADRALKHIRSLINDAHTSHALAGHRIDDVEDSAESITRAAVVVADVSAIAMDAVGLGRRILLLENTEKATRSASKNGKPTLATVVPSASPSYTGSYADLLRRIIDSEIPLRQERFRTHVFGERSLGTGTQRFVQACKVIKEERANESS